MNPDTYRRAPRVQLLPSAESALALARGEPGALWGVLAHTLARTLVMSPAGIAAGAAVGVSAGRAIAIVAGAAVAIEVGVIALAMRQVRDEAAKMKAQDAKPSAPTTPAAPAVPWLAEPTA